MHFAVEAMRPDGTTLAQRIEADNAGAAAETLREKGLVILRLDETSDAPPAVESSERHHARVAPRDLILLTRQMNMLLEAGTPLVPALESAEQQSARPAMRKTLRRLRQRVEEGDSLTEALEAEHGAFDAVFCSMVAAGEATASLPMTFGRLCELAQQQQKVRRMVRGALMYPTILSILLVAVVAVLIFFVAPRFKMLFVNLDSGLPAMTGALFAISETLRSAWPFVLGGFGAAVVGTVLLLRRRQTRDRLAELVLRLPLVGPMTSRLIFARVVRIWAAMLHCHVPLLDAIRQSRNAVSNPSFLDLIDHVEETVAGGGRVGHALSSTGLADPIVVSALRTGEENGRLTEATDFVSDWMDEDNATTVQNLTRLAEPTLLAVMGVIVGLVAIALFLPLFDMATAAG